MARLLAPGETFCALHGESGHGCVPCAIERQGGELLCSFTVVQPPASRAATRAAEFVEVE